MSEVLKVPGEPVGVLGEQYVEVAGDPGREGLQHARPVRPRGARDGLVDKDGDHHPAQPLGELPAELELLRDGARLLDVVRKAGVEGDADRIGR
ncbi:MAG: hypothetical protein KF737_03205 [Phenylobacterium sp.]|nr:hypothetical protein [Phenylobacterium sp.]MBX3482499.1 hypothetical protein [Phenylobacterium sp.]